MISFISEIEQALFDFHLNPQRMAQAMTIVARTVQAEYAFILIVEAGHIHTVFQGNEGNLAIAGLVGQPLQSAMPHWQAKWVQNISSQNTAADAPEPERSLLGRLGLADCYGLPVFDAAQGLHAVCCISGWDGSDRRKELLQHIVIAFALALNNREAHETIEQMGRMDMNTGLLNRNAYMSFVSAYEPAAGQVVTCIYADVNGLHEMNNRQGHEAGDRMLQAVAACLQETFPRGCHYRLGGDEFLTIVFSQALEETEGRVRHIQEELTKRQYFVSFGIVRDDQGMNLDTIVERADQQMLAAKRHYYQTIGDRRQH
jgi:diguanylate cyclase (GGDEF)-like protein